MTEGQRQRLAELRATHFVDGRRTAEFILTASEELLKEVEWLVNLEEEAEWHQQKMEFIQKRFTVEWDRMANGYVAIIDAEFRNESTTYENTLKVLEEFVTQFYNEGEGDL